MRPNTRNLLGVSAASALAGGWLALTAAPAAADLTIDTAQCRGSADITGDNGTSAHATESTNKFTIPPSGQYSAAGSIYGGVEQPQKRSFSGFVAVDFPPPFGSLAPKFWSWSGSGTGTTNKEPLVGHYEIPTAVPAGIPLPVIAEHFEKGVKVCEYHGTVKVEGASPMTSPVGIGLALATLVTGTGTVLAGRPRLGK
jgi:hypothetical protein